MANSYIYRDILVKYDVFGAWITYRGKIWTRHTTQEIENLIDLLLEAG